MFNLESWTSSQSCFRIHNYFSYVFLLNPLCLEKVCLIKQCSDLFCVEVSLLLDLLQATMEEIAGFEERLTALKEQGEGLVQGCSDRVQSRLRQQVQTHQQGIRDSYSAICSTAQRVSREQTAQEKEGAKENDRRVRFYKTFIIHGM